MKSKRMRTGTLARIVPFAIALAAALAAALPLCAQLSARVAPDPAPPAARPDAPAASTPELRIVGQYGGDVRAVAAYGDMAVIGVGPRVAVIDLRDPASPRLVGRTGVLEGTVIDLAVRGHLAFAVAGGLSVVDLSDPTAPVRIGFLALGEHHPTYGWTGPAHVAAGEGLVVLTGNSEYGLGRPHVVDVTDPRDPTLAARFELYDAIDVAIVADVAWVTREGCWDGTEGCDETYPAVLGLDVADPASPRLVGAFASRDGAGRIAADGARIVVTKSTCGVTVIDVSDPASPRQERCGNLFARDNVLTNVLDGVAVAGSTAFVLDALADLWVTDLSAQDPRTVGHLAIAVSPEGKRRFVDGGDAEVVMNDAGGVLVALGGFGLAVVNADDLGDVREVGAVEFEEDIGTGQARLVISGTVGYARVPVSEGDRGLHILDLVDPTAPRVVGYIPSPVAFAAPLGDRHIVLYNDLARQLRVFDVSDPTQPVFIAGLDLFDAPNCMASSGAYAYVVDRLGLHVIDFRDVNHPARVGSTIPCVGYDLAIGDGHAYVAGDGLTAIDVRDPRSPRHVATVRDGAAFAARRVVVADGLAFVADWQRGVTAFDVRDPAHPVELWTTDPLSFFLDPHEDLALAGGRLYVAGGGLSGLWAFDQLDSHPRDIAVVRGRDETVAVAAHGSMAVTLERFDRDGSFTRYGMRLRVLDVSDTADVRVVGTWLTRSGFHQAAVDDGVAVLGGSLSSLHTVDTSRPAAPRGVATLADPEGVLDIARSGRFLYVAGIEWTLLWGLPNRPIPDLRVIDVGDPSAPKVVRQLDVRLARDTDLSSGRLLVATEDGLTVLDVAMDPTEPQVVASLDAPYGYTCVAGAGRYAYARRTGLGPDPDRPVPPRLDVIDLDGPAGAAVVASLEIGDAGTVVAAIDSPGDLVYLAIRRSDTLPWALVVVDATVPTRPAILGLWESDDALVPNGITVVGRYAFLSTSAGVRVFDVVVPGYPVELARLDTPDEDSWYKKLEIAVGTDGRLYLPRGDAGLLVIDAVLPPGPAPTAGPSPTRTATRTPYPTASPAKSPKPTLPSDGPTRTPTATRIPPTVTPSRTVRPTHTATVLATAHARLTPPTVPLSWRTPTGTTGPEAGGARICLPIAMRSG